MVNSLTFQDRFALSLTFGLCTCGKFRSTKKFWGIWFNSHCRYLKVPITPEFFLAKMKLRQTHKKNLPKFSVCDIF